jgi:RimJ/RimL family protein N-acetyltransferase
LNVVVADFSDKPTIRGERIVLRPIVAADATSMLADLDDDDGRRLTGTHRTFEPSEIERWAATRSGADDRIDLAITDRGTGDWLGEVVVNDWDPANRSCGFRIAVSRAARDRGVGTEATRLLIDYVFEEIDDPPVNRIELEVFTFNPRAIHVYETIGFRREGVRRQALRWDGSYVDAVVMSIVRSDLTSD